MNVVTYQGNWLIIEKYSFRSNGTSITAFSLLGAPGIPVTTVLS